MAVVISNPPYNLKWEPQPFAEMDSRFSLHGVPPASNGNFAFVLSAMEKADKGIFILPNGALSSQIKEEKAITKSLVESNIIESVIACPGNMFEKTAISVVILILNKKKETSKVTMIDLRNSFETEEREQKGQFGGKSHTNRVYKKQYNILSDKTIQKVLKTISEGVEENAFSKIITLEDIRQNNYILTPSRYIDLKVKLNYRNPEDIVKDLNLILKEKNKCKMSINETIGKTLGFDKNLYVKRDNKELNEFMKKIGADQIIKDDYITFTKNAGELKFENKSKTEISSVLMMILNTWKQHVYYLNAQENVYLAELRDVMLYKLMSGEVEI